MMESLSIENFDANHSLYQTLSSLGLPNSKTEQYKKFPIKKILSQEYNFKKLSIKKAIQGTRLVIENGIVLEYPEGVQLSVNSLFDVDLQHYDVLYFASHILSSRVLCLEVLEDRKFEIEHIFTDTNTLLSYRIAIKTIPNIKVEIFEHFTLKGSEESFLLYGVDVEIKDSTTLQWIRNEKRAKGEAYVIGSHRYDVRDYAALELQTFDFGSADSLHLYKIDLQKYAWINASHLLLAQKDARRGNVVHINHNAEYAKSVQEARSILQDSSRGIFDAKIYVGNNARYSNASQNSKAILLGKHALMYAKPQLEIYIDELEASHGSSIGTLDEQELFYLCSRGIALKDAREMLVLAFANTLVDMVSDKNYRQRINNDYARTSKGL